MHGRLWIDSSYGQNLAGKLEADWNRDEKTAYDKHGSMEVETTVLQVFTTIGLRYESLKSSVNANHQSIWQNVHHHVSHAYGWQKLDIWSVANYDNIDALLNVHHQETQNKGQRYAGIFLNSWRHGFHLLLFGRHRWLSVVVVILVEFGVVYEWLVDGAHAQLL